MDIVHNPVIPTGKLCELRVIQYHMIISRRLTLSDRTEFLRINEASRPGVVAIHALEFERLMALPNRHLAIEHPSRAIAGYALVFTDSAPYDGEEFQVFRRMLSTRFTYIDQVAVQKNMRRMRLGSALYDAVEDEARRSDMPVLCCEINIDPPNPGSMAFHHYRIFYNHDVLHTADGRTVALMIKNMV